MSDIINCLKELMEAAEPFTADTVGDETSETIPLINCLIKALDKADECIEKIELKDDVTHFKEER